MLSLVDCIAFSGLTPDQLDAIACNKHVPMIVAAEWAETRLECADGSCEIEALLAAEVLTAHAHHPDREDAWTRALVDFRRGH